MNHEVIIDILTICVMTAAVYYAARLNRSLTRARDGRSELIQLIASLTDAQSRAEASIQIMKATAAEYELSLTKQIAVSRGLADELAMINDSGNTLASRLERLAPLARGNAEAAGARFAAEMDDQGRNSQTLRAERPFTASQDMKPTRAKPPEEKAPAKVQATAATSRSEKPVQAAAPAAAAARAPARAAEEPADNRSRAERELFAAIETLRKGGRPA